MQSAVGGGPRSGKKKQAGMEIPKIFQNDKNNLFFWAVN